MTRPRQLTIPLDLPARFSAEDFLVAPANEAAHALISRWPDWPVKGVLLTGPAGSGKSHLAAIWAERAQAPVFEAAALDDGGLPELFEASALVLENVDAQGVSEKLLFHALNTARERGTSVLLTSAKSPDLVWPALPDLGSRLRAFARADLSPLGDDFVRTLLVKLFDDRQLAVEAEVIDYIARRMERSPAAARRLVAALDEEALALGRRVTKPVAAAVLARLDEAEEET